jgi:hypothetical protein
MARVAARMEAEAVPMVLAAERPTAVLVAALMKQEAEYITGPALLSGPLMETGKPLADMQNPAARVACVPVHTLGMITVVKQEAIHRAETPAWVVEQGEAGHPTEAEDPTLVEVTVVAVVTNRHH